MTQPDTTEDTPLTGAMRRVLAPLVRLLIARGVRFQAVSDWLKDAYLASAMRHFTPPGKRLTDSRLSVLTGLQRKDIKAIRARQEAGAPAGRSAGPLPRIISSWRTRPDFADAGGGPRVLPRADFDRLAATVTTDTHPRSILDEMLRLDLIEETDDGIRLTAEAFIPARDEAALMGYLGANLGDHSRAAVDNVLAEGTAPHFERAVHYNRLAPAAIAELEAMARALQQQALERIDARARELQDRDGTDPQATGRFRCGAYILAVPDEQAEMDA